MGKATIGWREWVGLPDLDLPLIKAKVDTGARTSALHAFEVEEYTDQGSAMVRFGIHPLQKRMEIARRCTAPVIDRRVVTDSGGHRETRFVIETRISMGGQVWPIELTLTDRESMLFRMLLGRTAMQGRFSVDPGTSFLLGKPSAKTIAGHYGG